MGTDSKKLFTPPSASKIALEKLRKQLEPVLNGEVPFHTGVAAVFTPYLKALKAGRFLGLNKKIKKEVVRFHETLTQTDEKQLKAAEDLITTVTDAFLDYVAQKEHLLEQFKKAAMQDSPHEDALKYAQNAKALVKDVPEEAHLESSLEIADVLPDDLRKAMMIAAGEETDAPSAENIKAWREKITNSTEEQLATEKMRGLLAVPVESITKAIHEILQKANKDTLKVFVDHLNENLSADDYTNLTMTALDFIEEFGTAAKKGNFLQVKDKKRAAPFAGNAKRTLLILEQAFTKAGLMPDTDLKTIEQDYKNNQQQLKKEFY